MARQPLGNGAEWLVHVDQPSSIAHRHYLSNKIQTSKYTWYNFLPKNLFEQFHRLANLYFLGLVILNWIPQLNVFGKEISMFPLLIVLAATAIKDGYEDSRRHRSDREINAYPSYVVDPSGLIGSKPWAELAVGEVVVISRDELVPADVVLVASSDLDGHCYTSTMNLDGETNLKLRRPANCYQNIHRLNDKEFSKRDDNQYRIICEAPSRNLHKFQGYVEETHGDVDIGLPGHLPSNQIALKTSRGSAEALTIENILLRGSVLRNTEWVLGVVIYAGHQTKVMLNGAQAPSKRSKLERSLNMEIFVLVFLLLALCVICAVCLREWLVADGHIEAIFYYKDPDDGSPEMLAFLGFWQFIIVFQVMIPIALYISMEFVKLLQASLISSDLNLYDESSDTPCVCRALNIAEDLGQVSLIFSDKTGTLTENKMEFKYCSLASGLFTASPSLSTSFSSNTLQEVEIATRELEEKLPSELRTRKILRYEESDPYIKEFLIAMAVCNEVFPVSMSSPDIGDSSEHDIAGGPKSPNAWGTPQSHAVPHGGEHTPPHLIRPRNLAFLQKSVRYEGESSDEIALVKASSSAECALSARDKKSVSVFFGGEEHDFEVISILPFDATRKRMSVIIRFADTDELVMFTKGADISILPLCKEDSSLPGFVARVTDHVDGYASVGLRTLCFAKRILTPEMFSSWEKQYQEALRSLGDREERMGALASSLETGFTLLGCTAIEDRLSVGVPETIAALRAAAIGIWVLTGDKKETAINIAMSCALIPAGASLVHVVGHDTLTVLQSIQSFLVHHDDESVVDAPLIAKDDEEEGVRVLVIDGISLEFALQPQNEPYFLSLASKCVSVVCCRASPAQKAAVVHASQRHSPHIVTLAVGDGANDVNMIQSARIGVGIKGSEGSQASMASDFVLAKFAFLRPLLLVHGHWCYSRLGEQVLYILYKNALFVFLLFWFQIYAAFSAQSAISDLYLILFSVLFTSVPTIVVAVLDQDVSRKVLMQYPSLYESGQRSLSYNKPLFWILLLDSIYQSLCLFYVPFFAYRESVIGLYELGTVFSTAAVFAVNLHLALDINMWNWVVHSFLWGTLVFYVLFSLIYSLLPLAPDQMCFIMMMRNPIFWFAAPMAVFLSLFPRLLVLFLKFNFHPNPIDHAKVLEKKLA